VCVRVCVCVCVCVYVCADLNVWCAQIYSNSFITLGMLSWFVVEGWRYGLLDKV
jgi:hypothetical protein